MILVDYFSFSPRDELYAALERVPSDEYAHPASLEGRLVCVWKCSYHLLGIYVKTAFYLAIGITLLPLAYLIGHQTYTAQSLNFLKCALITPVGQALLAAKAALGILYPAAYFKNDELKKYFVQLAAIAEEVGCEEELVELLKQGSSILQKSFQYENRKRDYEALVKRDLILMCEKFSEPQFPQDQKLTLINMLHSDESEGSGIHACPTGFIKILEQICASVDVPAEPEKVMPWLIKLYKEEVVHLMVVQQKQLQLSSLLYTLSEDRQQAHTANDLIVALGEKAQLPQDLIDQALLDLTTEPMPEQDKDKLLQAFNEIYTEDSLVNYLMQKINSQPDGTPGLKIFRDYIFQELASHVSEQELESSKEDVMEKFGVGEALADDPSLYVKLHYQLYPDLDPSDERQSDFNEEGIKAFAQLLTDNPFAYFN